MARKLVYYVACTLDGFIARSDGSFDCFLYEGDHFADLMDQFPETFPVHLRPMLGITQSARRFDTVLMGRNTYDVGVREGVTSPYAPLRQFVVSQSMTRSLDDAVELHRGSPLELVQALKQQQGKDIWLCGGARLAGTLLAEIDEFIFKVNPILIGRGIPLFEGGREGTTLPATLIHHNVYPNGFALKRYARGPGRVAS